MPEGDAPCVVKDGEVAVGGDGLNCDVEQGAILRILVESPAPAKAPRKDEPQVEPASSSPQPLRTPTPSTRMQPHEAAPVAKPSPVEKHMEPEADTDKPANEGAHEGAHEAREGVPEKPARSKGFHEEVGTPDAGVADLSQFSGLAESNGGLALILSIVAVAGGGAAWKFYSQSSSQKHELEMARLEKGQNDHAACETKRQELAARLDALERKFTGAIDLDAPSTTDLDKKVKNLERRLRELKSPRKA